MMASRVRSFCAIGGKYLSTVARSVTSHRAFKFERQTVVDRLEWPHPLTITASNLSFGTNSSMYDPSWLLIHVFAHKEARFIQELAPLNARTAMQYFEASPWYRIEPPSNNQILRMQNTGVDVNEINEAEQLRCALLTQTSQCRPSNCSH